MLCRGLGVWYWLLRIVDDPLSASGICHQLASCYLLFLFSATMIIAFHSPANRPTGKNLMLTNPALDAIWARVVFEKNLICPPSQSTPKCRSQPFVTERARFFK